MFSASTSFFSISFSPGSSGFNFDLICEIRVSIVSIFYLEITLPSSGSGEGEKKNFVMIETSFVDIRR